MLTEKKDLANQVVSMSIGVDELAALTDFFSGDEKKSKAILDIIGVDSTILDDEKRMTQGYAELLSDNVLEVNFNDQFIVHELTESDYRSTMMGFILGTLISDAIAYTEIAISLNTSVTKMVSLHNDSSWVAMWPSKSGKEVSFLIGNAVALRGMAISTKLRPFLERTVAKRDSTGRIVRHSSTLMILVSMRSLDGGRITGTAISGSAPVFLEKIPSDLTLVDDALMKTPDGIYYSYTMKGVLERFERLMEVM